MKYPVLKFHRAAAVAAIMITAIILALIPSASASETALSADINIEFKKGLTAYNLGKFQTAARIWKRIADKGVGSAQSGLALLYYTGSGVAKDFGLARKLFLEAAVQNVPQAQMFLSLIYRNGDGVRQSYVHSYMWCDIAVGAGDEGASYVRERIAENMTADEVAEAQRLSSEWRAFYLK